MIDHIGIPVKDLEESRKFYEKLGFEMVNQWEKPKQELKAIFMRDESGYKIELIYHPTNKDIVFPKIIEVLHFAIVVVNLEERLQDLIKEGIKTVVPITKGVTVKQFAFIKDPNGFSIALEEL